MGIQFKVNAAGEGVLTDSLAPQEYDELARLVKMEQVHHYKHMYVDKSHPQEFKELLDSVLEDAQHLNFAQPDFLLSNYILSEYYRVNKNVVQALNFCTRGMERCLKAIPKNFNGNLSNQERDNQDFYLLLDQYIGCMTGVIKAYRYFRWGDVDWKVLDALKDVVESVQPSQMIEKMEKEFPILAGVGADTLGKLIPLVSNRDESIYQNHAVLLASIGDYAAAKKILLKQDHSFFKYFNLAAIDYLEGNYAQALFNFRFGMMLNPAFGRVLSQDNESYFLFYPNKEMDYQYADDYFAGMIGSLWWDEHLLRFGAWASESWPVLQDRSVYKRAKQEQARAELINDDNSIIDACAKIFKMSECKEAVAMLLSIEGAEVLPWELQQEGEV